MEDSIMFSMAFLANSASLLIAGIGSVLAAFIAAVSIHLWRSKPYTGTRYTIGELWRGGRPFWIGTAGRTEGMYFDPKRGVIIATSRISDAAFIESVSPGKD